MHYDLDLVCELCREIGLKVHAQTQHRVDIDLGHGAILCVQNHEQMDDCAIGFLDTAWHVHEDIIFADARGYYITLDYLDLLVGLKDGRVLLCEMETQGRTADRWLAHSEYNNEFRGLQEGERIIVRRAVTATKG